MLLVIGLDGATFDLMRPWAEEGRLPNLAGLMSQGVWGELQSTVPPLSGPAWVTFMTGKNPGRHGVFHFRELDFRRYDCFGGQLVTSGMYSHDSIFRRLSEHGCSMGLVSVPMTYPPFEVNGFMISGYPTPDLHRPYTYPKHLASEIGEWHISDDQPYLYLAPDERLRQARWIVNKYTEFSLNHLSKGAFDLFMVVFNNIDMAHHLFWRFMDPGHPAYDSDGAQLYRDAILDQYRHADWAVGRLVDCVGDDSLVVVMSDHGGGPAPPYYVHLNQYFKRIGLLHPRRAQMGRERLGRTLSLIKDVAPHNVRRFIRDNVGAPITRRLFGLMHNLEGLDWAKTSVYAARIDHSTVGIEVNLRGRQEHGIVTGESYPALREQLREHLLTLADPGSGERIVEKVWLREELYSGRYADQAPDIVAALRSPYTMGNGTGSLLLGEVEGPLLRQFSGTHRSNGIIVAHGKQLTRAHELQGATIADLAPTLLYALGKPIPADMDGRVLTELFEASHLASRPPQAEAAVPETTSHPPADDALTDEDEAGILDRLRDLGYLS